MSTNTEKIFNNFGETLLYALELKGYSQSSFSDKTDVAKSQLSRYVNNISLPRPNKIREFEHLLSIRLQKEGEQWKLVDLNDAQKAVDEANYSLEKISKNENSNLSKQDIRTLLKQMEATVQVILRNL